MSNSPQSSDIRLYMENSLDRVTQAFGSIDVAHKNIHNGEGYELVYSTATVAAGSSLIVNIHTPTLTASKPYAHFQDALTELGSSPARFRFIEGGNAALATSTLTAYNKNRFFASTAPSNVVCMGAVVATYTAAGGEVVISDSKKSSQASQRIFNSIGKENTQEWVLANDQDYTFVVTNDSSTATSAEIHLFWYEEGAGGTS